MSALPLIPKPATCWALPMDATAERRWASDAARNVEHVYIKQRLHPGLLDTMKRGGAQAIEIFAARGHFNYTTKNTSKNWATGSSQKALSCIPCIHLFI